MINDNQAQPIQLDGPYLEILALKQSGLCCSQIIVKLAMRDLGKDNPDLVRSMAALCYGSYAGGTCGVLTGAACALSLCLDNNSDRECQDPLLPLLLGELSDWFTVNTSKNYGGILCEEILAASHDKRACTLLLISTLEKLQSMLAATGIAAKGSESAQP